MKTEDLAEKHALKHCEEACKTCGSKNECDKSDIGYCLPTMDKLEDFKAGFIKAMKISKIIWKQL